MPARAFPVKWSTLSENYPQTVFLLSLQNSPQNPRFNPQMFRFRWRFHCYCYYYCLAAFFTVTDALLPDMESISSLESKITPSLAETERAEFPALTAFNVTV